MKAMKACWKCGRDTRRCRHTTDPLDDVDDPDVTQAGNDMMAKYRIGWLDLFDSYWWTRWDRLCRLRALWKRNAATRDMFEGLKNTLAGSRP